MHFLPAVGFKIQHTEALIEFWGHWSNYHQCPPYTPFHKLHPIATFQTINWKRTRLLINMVLRWTRWMLDHKVTIQLFASSVPLLNYNFVTYPRLLSLIQTLLPTEWKCQCFQPTFLFPSSISPSHLKFCYPCTNIFPSTSSSLLWGFWMVFP